MKVPAWEIWSNEHNWGMRELDTRKLREGASIQEAYSDTVWHIDMGCPVDDPRFSSDDAQFMGEFLKDFAWKVAVPQLLDDHRSVFFAYNKLASEMNAIQDVADRLTVTPIDEDGKAVCELEGPIEPKVGKA